MRRFFFSLMSCAAGLVCVPDIHGQIDQDAAIHHRGIHVYPMRFAPSFGRGRDRRTQRIDVPIRTRPGATSQDPRAAVGLSGFEFLYPNFDVPYGRTKVAVDLAEPGPFIDYVPVICTVECRDEHEETHPFTSSVEAFLIVFDLPLIEINSAWFPLNGCRPESVIGYALNQRNSQSHTTTWLRGFDVYRCRGELNFKKMSVFLRQHEVALPGGRTWDVIVGEATLRDGPGPRETVNADIAFTSITHPGDLWATLPGVGTINSVKRSPAFHYTQPPYYVERASAHAFAGLTGFRLEYTAGDEKLRALQAGTRVQAVDYVNGKIRIVVETVASLRDNSNSDEFSAEVSHALMVLE